MRVTRTKCAVLYDGREYTLQRRAGHCDTVEKYLPHHRQYKTTSFKPLVRHYLRNNSAFCVIAVTMLDLYSSDDDEFSMGQASIGGSRPFGICSFARYSPRFQLNLRVQYRAMQSADESIHLATLCAIKTLAHEILHVFGITHCVFNSCLMQGRYTALCRLRVILPTSCIVRARSGNLHEDFNISHHLCLVDLHKLIHALGLQSPTVMQRRFTEVGQTRLYSLQ